MLSRPLITTITPHEFCDFQTSSTLAPSSSSSFRIPSSRRMWWYVVECSMIVVSLLCVMVPSISAQDCILTIPAQPLTADGLATPWILSGPGCSQTNPNTQTFVQGAVLDTKLGTVSIYDPLVVDQGQKPFAKPVTPTIIQANVTAYWIQTQATTITLNDTVNGAALQVANCSSGLVTPAGTSKFGKVAFCNAYLFFKLANQQVAGGQLAPPGVGKGSQDGLPCPSFRDYSFLGRDYHGTVMTSYLVNQHTNQIAHDNPTNNKACNGACTRIQSDSARLINNVYSTIGCVLWAVQDLADPTGAQLATALPLNELQARVATATTPPNQVALIPALDTLATVAGLPNLQKLNLIRDGFNQPQVATLAGASTVDYCVAMTTIPPPRLAADSALLKAFQRQGDITEAVDLYTLVVKRQIELYTALGCPTIAPVPFQVVPPDWTILAATPLQNAIPVQPNPMVQQRCQNMLIIDTKCSFLVAIIVVGGGIVLGFIMFILLKMVQSWKYGDKAIQQDSTRAAIRV